MPNVWLNYKQLRGGNHMLGIGAKLPEFKIIGVKPGFNFHEENEESAFEDITEQSFPGQWKVIYYYPKDFTFVCPTEILGFAKLAEEFSANNSVLLGGSTDNEHCKLAWRRANSDLNRLNHWSFADILPQWPTNPDKDGFRRGNLIDQLEIRHPDAGVALRATYIIDPDNIVQHVGVNGLDVGRNPAETLRILKALQTGELVGCPL
jgi:lipoyl-dependent peroxiredoxin subunit C